MGFQAAYEFCRPASLSDTANQQRVRVKHRRIYLVRCRCNALNLRNTKSGGIMINILGMVGVLATVAAVIGGLTYVQKKGRNNRHS